jgi:hypothetical protein
VSVLRRQAVGTFREVAQEWHEATAVLIGGGPSLTVEQVEQVRAARRGHCLYTGNRHSGTLNRVAALWGRRLNGMNFT